MKTIGIDMAVQPVDTAAAAIHWHDGTAEVQPPLTRCSDVDILTVLTSLESVDHAGIDCPFGWPQTFAEALQSHAAGAPWPGRSEPLAHYELSRLRLTDRVVDAVVRPIAKKGPLSVSMDKLGATAWRWAWLADRLSAEGHPVDRSGAGPIHEVYPAGSRAVWDLGLGKDRSTSLVAVRAPWLRFAPGAQDAYDRSEHAFDALIASMTARATALGLTRLPDNDDERRFAVVEGWIHLPQDGSWAKLNA